MGVGVSGFVVAGCVFVFVFCEQIHFLSSSLSQTLMMSPLPFTSMHEPTEPNHAPLLDCSLSFFVLKCHPSAVASLATTAVGYSTTEKLLCNLSAKLKASIISFS